MTGRGDVRLGLTSAVAGVDVTREHPRVQTSALGEKRKPEDRSLLSPPLLRRPVPPEEHEAALLIMRNLTTGRRITSEDVLAALDGLRARAERGGFEPPRASRPNRFSKRRAHSVR
jgi:hypothetical protein